MAFHAVADVVFGLRFPLGALSSDETFGHFRAWAAGWFTLGMDLPFSTYRRALQAREALVDALTEELEHIAKHPESDRQPGLRELVAARDNDGYRLSTSEIIANIIGTIFAGYSTVAGMSMQMMMALAKHPKVWNKLKDEQERVVAELGPQVTGTALGRMSYAEAVIREVCRTAKFGPQFRLVTEAMDVDGYHIPKGWLLVLYAAFSECYLDDRWPMDDSFDPDRHLSVPDSRKRWPLNFGWGPHVCMGRFLSMVELKALLASLARGYTVELLEPDAELRFPTMEPPGGMPVVVRRSDG
ncbi:unnamed protein product [Ostreobium quekettii]|uniref:Cytochrome P450 n=1 Tax=Ostreobium quekettii TaxID=121088 RepID=A0A8S1IWV2_9CHLO|nr:unnamed protein product [Ostreobium quekettii]